MSLAAPHGCTLYSNAGHARRHSRHSRSEVSVGAARSHSDALHTGATSAHTRFDVVVGTADSYCCCATQSLTGAQTRLVVRDAARASHSLSVHTRVVSHTRSDVSVGAAAC